VLFSFSFRLQRDSALKKQKHTIRTESILVYRNNKQLPTPISGMTATMEMIWLVSGSHNDNECMGISLFISAIIALIKCFNDFLTWDGCVSVPQGFSTLS